MKGSKDLKFKSDISYSPASLFFSLKQSRLSADLKNSDLEAGVTLLIVSPSHVPEEPGRNRMAAAVPGLGKAGKAPVCTQLVQCCVTFPHHVVLGFHLQAHWFLDPFNHPTEDDSKHLPKALQVSQLSHPLSHLILTMTLSGEKDRLYFIFFTFILHKRTLKLYDIKRLAQG